VANGKASLAWSIIVSSSGSGEAHINTNYDMKRIVVKRNKVPLMSNLLADIVEVLDRYETESGNRVIIGCLIELDGGTWYEWDGESLVPLSTDIKVIKKKIVMDYFGHSNA